MFVEYLFQINPLTLFIVVATFIFLLSQSRKKKTVEKVFYESTPIEYLKVGQDSTADESFLVMSYNIMAYNFTKFQWFSYCSPDFLPPKYRSPRIIYEIEQVNPDILALQECDHDLFADYYKPNLEELGYECVYQGVTSNRIVTSVIAFKKSAFTKEKWNHMDLNEDLVILDDSFQKHKEAIMALLKHKNTGKQVVVANTHLFWNPDFEYVKYGQMSKILNYIEKNYKHIPIIFCGDFNANPSSNVLKFVYLKAPEFSNSFKGDISKNKKFIDLFWNEYRHGLNLKSAYDNYKKILNNEDTDTDAHPDFTTYTQEFVGNLDYIIYTPEKLNIIELLKVPTNDPEVRSLRLPNYRYPSDHLKIGSRFKFIK